MNNISKRICSVVIVAITVLCMVLLAGCGGETNDLEEFYSKVSESQKCLDIVADDIYTCWYDAIYKDKYFGDINMAIANAQSTNSTNLDKIEANESEIQALYKKVRDSKYSDQVKDVMSAYSDYYEFVVNVSGSFNTFSAQKETLKKKLASALKDLSLEL